MQANVRYNNLHGIAQALALNTFQPFLGIFAIKLGGSDLIVALLSALPALTSAMIVIPGAYWLEKQPRRKLPTAVFFLISRSFLLFLACIPLLSKGLQAPALAALVGVMNLPAAIAAVSWQALCADVFPLAERARIFAARNRWMGLAGLPPTLLIGFFLDWVKFPLGYQLIFLAGLCFSLLEIWFLLRISETSPPCPIVPGTRSLASIKKEAPFWRFTLVSLCFYFPWQMGWPLFTIYQVRELHATNLWMAIFAVVGTAANWLSSRWWVRHAESKGTTPMLVLATGGLSLTPIMFILVSSLYPIAVFNLVIGIFSAGATLLFFNGLLEVLPAQDRAAYIAYNNSLVNLSAFVAPLIGSLVAGLVGIKAALAIVAAGRLLGALAIGRWLASSPARQLAQSAQPSAEP